MAVIEIVNGQLADNQVSFKTPVNLVINKGEQIAICGPNASGKTLLAEALAGKRMIRGISYDFISTGKKFVSSNIRYICFHDSYGDSGYYQQRWNQGEIDPETPTVGEVLSRLQPDNPERFRRLTEMFGMDKLYDNYTISLSSGELRKFQLTRMLVNTPSVLIIDNPFIGLDASSRGQFSELLASLSDEITIILVVSREDEIPSFITHIVRVEDMRVGQKVPWMSSVPEVLRFTDVTVSYGGRTILKKLNWCVRRGEKWALSGKNGSGKSLLLSLVCADNPQAYACNISLFGRRRGTGESIWDIKKRIGYVSPEMHRSFSLTAPALDVVCSGHFDTVGLVRMPSEEQIERGRIWMETFGISHLADRPFNRMSGGEQRLCLLARAFVKDPELLILDEPMHGLDEAGRVMARDIINRWASREGKTLIMVTHYMEELPSCIGRRLVLA